MNCRRQLRHRYFCFRLRVVPFLTTFSDEQLGQAISSKHTLQRVACSSPHHKFSITTVLSNCSVGLNDKNLWLYRIHERGFTLLDSVNLKVKESLDQVFNFCVEQVLIGNKQYFFSATQEGVIWIGSVENDRFVLIGKQEVSTRIGAALAYEPFSGLLAVAGDNIHLFEVK